MGGYGQVGQGMVRWCVKWDRAWSGGAGGVSDGTGHGQMGQVVCQMGQGMVKWGRAWSNGAGGVAVTQLLCLPH